MAVSDSMRSSAGAAGGLAGRAPVTHPLWARWNDDLDQRYTLGVEEEVMLLDPSTWSLSHSSDRVQRRLSAKLSRHTSLETHAAVLELVTGIHPDVDAVIAELASLRERLRLELSTMRLTAAAGGMHPLSLGEASEISDGDRYRRLSESMRALARREPTMALHVHVGVPAPEEAIRVLNGLRRNIPVLLALAANSPFWQGSDSGFASARTVIFQAFPRTGPSRCFEDYGDYVDAVDPLIASGAIPDPSFLWWDVRLSPSLGTVEVRVMDTQSTIADVAPIVALIQSLARLELEGGAASPGVGPEVLAENRFLAARDGMDAQLIDSAGGRLIPVRETLCALVDECRPHAYALGCADALERVGALAAAPGADRQRAIARGGRGLDNVVAVLADRFPAPPSRRHRNAVWTEMNNPTERGGTCVAGSHTPDLPSSSTRCSTGAPTR